MAAFLGVENSVVCDGRGKKKPQTEKRPGEGPQIRKTYIPHCQLEVRVILDKISLY